MANGWTFIDSKYSSEWNESGQLFRKPSVEDYNYYTLNISAGTAVTTIATIIDIWATRGGLITMLRSLNYAIIGSSIDEPIIGSMDATKYKDTLKVVSQGKLGLKTYKHRVVTTHNGKTATAFDGGDSRSYDALLDAGIYNVVVLN